MKKRSLKQTLIYYYEHPRKFLILFLFILVELISYPLFMNIAMSGIIFNIASTFVLLAAITAVFEVATWEVSL